METKEQISYETYKILIAALTRAEVLLNASNLQDTALYGEWENILKQADKKVADLYVKSTI